MCYRCKAEELNILANSRQFSVDIATSRPKKRLLLSLLSQLELLIQDIQQYESMHQVLQKVRKKKLARWQRIMSRRQKGGSNWNKARIKVARIHEKMSMPVVNLFRRLASEKHGKK